MSQSRAARWALPISGSLISSAISRRSRAASARDAAVALVQGTPMRADIEEVAPGQLDAATDVAERALRQFEGPDGFDAPMSAHVVTATK